LIFYSYAINAKVNRVESIQIFETLLNFHQPFEKILIDVKGNYNNMDICWIKTAYVGEKEFQTTNMFLQIIFYFWE